jgi:hypothetical protein
VAGGDQLGDQWPSDCTAGTRDKDSHDQFL